MDSVLYRIYYSMPIFVQNIFISIFGFYWYKRRFGGVFKKVLLQTKSREFFSEMEWFNYQERELRKILIHSFTTVPYYTNIFNLHGFTLQYLKNISVFDIKNLPILKKSDLRNHCTNTLLSNNLEKPGTFLQTSGSTGSPLQIYYSKRMHQEYFTFVETYIHNWAGVNYKTPRGMIGGRKILKNATTIAPFYRYNYFEKQVYFSAYHISKDTVKDYIDGMFKYKIEYMTGYASSNYFLARFIEESGLIAPKLKAVITSSEKLTPEMRDTFKRVYGCDTFDSYNGVDLCNLISECEYHRLHIIPDVGLIEVLDEYDNPVKLGEVGEIVATGFLNYNQPLIRYRTGDFVKLSLNQKCDCGRSMTIIDEIIGRQEDLVILSDGKEMVRFHSITYGISSIIESQIIQHDFEKFEILIVVSRKPTENELDKIKKNLYSQIGEVNVKISIVENIARTSNGKFKAVISYLKRE